MAGACTAVVMGGVSAEHPVSLASGRAVCEALAGEGYDRVLPVRIETCGSWVCGTDGLRSPLEALTGLVERGVQVCFLALHGPGGEDGTIQGLLESLGLPYTGSGVRASALAMSKVATRAVLRDQGGGLELAAGFVADPDLDGDFADRLELQVGYPCFVKEDHSGSSLGVHRLTGPADLDRLLSTRGERGLLVVEEAVEGIEASVATLGNHGRLHRPVTALPPVEIVPRTAEFFDYRAKYEPGATEEIVPPRNLAGAVCRRLEEQACRVHRILGCDGAARTDFIVHPTRGPVVLETNTLPGLTPNSLLPKAAAAVDMGFGKLVDLMVEMALEGR